MKKIILLVILGILLIISIPNAQAIDISNCTTLDTPNSIYYLTGAAENHTTCMLVSANNVTLDCQGHTLNHSLQGILGVGHGVYSNQNLTTVRNCVILEGEPGGTGKDGIHFLNVNNGTIFNNTITTLELNCRGIYLQSSYDINVSNNNVTQIALPGSTTVGIFIWSSSNNSFLGDKVTNRRPDFYGVEFYGDSTNNSFSGISIDTNSSGAYPFNIYIGNHNFTVRDSILNASYNGVPELYIRSEVTGGSWNFTNVTKTDGSSLNISWGTGANGTLNVFWYLDINVSTSAGAPIQNANVTVRDVNNTELFSVLTAADGTITTQTIQEYWRNGTTAVYYTNLTINTTIPGYNSDETEVNLSSNKQTDITLTSPETTSPDNVGFLSPTPSNHTNLTQNNYFVNVSFNDSFPQWCELELTNTSGTINYTMTQGANSSEYYFNVTGQSNYLTYFVAYCNDTSGNWNNSETRFVCLLYTSPSPRDRQRSRMPSSA